MDELPYREPPKRSSAPPPADDPYLSAWRKLTRLRRSGYVFGAVAVPAFAAFTWVAVSSPAAALRWLPFLFAAFVVPGAPLSIAQVRFRCPHCASRFHEKARATPSSCDSCGIEVGTPKHVAMRAGLTRRARVERRWTLSDEGTWTVAVVLVMGALAMTAFSLLP